MFEKLYSAGMASLQKWLRDWNEDRESEGKTTIGLHEITWKMKWLRYVVPERWLYEWMWRLVQLREERRFWHYLEDGNRRFGRPLSEAEEESLRQYERQFTNIRIQMMDNNTPIAGLCIDYMFFSGDSKSDDDHVCRLLFREGEFDTYVTPNQYLSDKFDETFERITRENCSFWYTFLERNRDRVILESSIVCMKRQYDETYRFVQTGKAIVHEAVFSFSEEEEKRGKEALENLGIVGPYICIFARDGRYNAEMRKVRSFSKDILDSRNFSINSFKELTDYFWRKGIQSVRMGALAAMEYQCEGAVDYANIGRTEFGDAYVFSKCRFFIGSASGIAEFPRLLGKPVVFVNMDSMMYFRDRTQPITLGIFLKYYNPETRHYLSFREWNEIFIKCFKKNIYYVEYMRKHYEIVHNTPEEILDVAKEMEAILNRTVCYTEHDEQLQRKYREIIGSYQSWFPILFCSLPGRIGAQWLRDNEWFLE